ncbi:MAG: hypothetical protein JWR38_3022 [Mucilaginibacter sp.]|nr:hypothetical protein [Mucilaginibacter sp.]
MKQFILINRVPSSYGLTEAKEVAETWKKVTDQWKTTEMFVASFVFPSEGNIIAGSPVNVSFGNSLIDNLKIVSVIIIRANDFDAAVELAKSSPILQQQGSIEIREIMDRPS